ncbi:hypothetical protein N7251_22525, partial [Escherichia coli]|nr:hypothetical protein [Escherichia coli]
KSTIQRGKPPEWWEKQKGSRGIRRGQWYRLVFQFPIREPVAKVCYAQMVKQFLSRDPFECVLCGCRMVYRRAIAGLNVSGLKKNARDISLLRYMPA